MKKLTNGLLALGLLLAVGFTSANAQDVTDKDIKNYAIIELAKNSIVKEISPMVNDMIEKQEGMTGQRFQQLQKGEGDAAEEWETQFVAVVNKQIDKKKKAATPAREEETKKEVTKTVEKEKPEETVKESKDIPVEEVKPEKKEEAAAEDNFIKTKVAKLTGPKIIDKIDLKEFEKKPVASSKDDKVSQKRKRKRITTPKRVSDAGARKGDDRGKGKGRRGKGAFKPEPTAEEIQKQIKETLARLAPSGKSKGAKHRRTKRAAVSQQIEEEQRKVEEEKGTLKLTEFVTVNELASMMNVNATDVISACMTLGLFVSINQRLDAETLNLVAEEFGFEVEFVSVEVQEAIESIEVIKEDESLLTSRSPIVTVMGHVDHGKTTLTAAMLTCLKAAGHKASDKSVDQIDAAPEEKERGITINLGFAHFNLPSGESIGIVDVPGHKDFIKTMVAGAFGVDIVLLVVAADSGIMPQTVEHLQIIELLGVENGIVVITKKDLADDEMLELAQLEVAEFLQGSILENAPVVQVSSTTGEGIDDLISEISNLIPQLKDKTKRVLSEVYPDRKIIFYEHGRSDYCKITDDDDDHCHHAHLHCVPVPMCVDIHSRVQDESLCLVYEGRSSDEESLKKAYKILNTEYSGPYIYIEQDDTFWIYCGTRNLRRQFLRWVLAKELNCGEEKACWLTGMEDDSGNELLTKQFEKIEKAFEEDKQVKNKTNEYS